MINEIQIEVIDISTGSLVGFLDLESSTDFPLKLTKEVGTIKNITTRRATYSFDFDLPATPNNKVLLFGAEYVPATGASNNILQKKGARIRANGNEVERGFIRFTEADYNGFFRATFYGGNSNWVELLSNLKLNELDWSSSGQVSPGVEAFNGTRFGILNNATSDTADICYPVVDRNSGMSVAELRPVFYLRKVIKRMFEKIGYSITSTLLDSTFFKGDGGEYKGLVLDPPFVLSKTQDEIDQLKAIAQTSRHAQNSDPDLWDLNYVIGNIGTDYLNPVPRLIYRFPNFFNNELNDASGAYNPATNTFTAQLDGNYTVRVDFPSWEYGVDTENTPVNWTLERRAVDTLTNPFLTTITNQPFVNWYLVKNNSASNTAIDGVVIADNTLNTAQFVETFIETKVLLKAGDTVTVFFKMANAPIVFDGYLDSWINWRWHPGYDAKFIVEPTPKIQLGDNILLNFYLSSDLNCLQLLQDFKLLFNLFFQVDEKRKTIQIETRDDYYLPVSQAIDISNKIDFSKKINIDRNTNQKKEITFSYIKDDQDGYLKKWEEIYQRNYGEYTHELSNRFEQGEDVYQTQKIAATIQDLEPNSNIVTSVVYPEFNPTARASKGEVEKYAPRVYQVKRAQQYDELGNPRRSVSPFIVSSALMEEHANATTIDNKKLTFNGANGLVEQFYSKTLRNIEEGAIVELYLVMNIYEFTNWNMRQPVYIADPPQLKGYYIVEAIENFFVAKNEPVKVRLLSYKDWVGATIPATNTNVAYTSTRMARRAQSSPLMVEVNGVIVPVLDDNFNQLYKI